jgi:hypothetical protein
VNSRGVLRLMEIRFITADMQNPWYSGRSNVENLVSTVASPQWHSASEEQLSKRTGEFACWCSGCLPFELVQYNPQHIVAVSWFLLSQVSNMIVQKKTQIPWNLLDFALN